MGDHATDHLGVRDHERAGARDRRRRAEDRHHHEPARHAVLRERDRGGERAPVVDERRHRALERRQGRARREVRLTAGGRGGHLGRRVRLLGRDRGHHHDVLAGVQQVRLEVVQRLGGDRHLTADRRLPDVADLRKRVADQGGHRHVVLARGAAEVGLEVHHLGRVPVDPQVAAGAVEHEVEPRLAGRERHLGGHQRERTGLDLPGERRAARALVDHGPGLAELLEQRLRAHLDARALEHLFGGLPDRRDRLLRQDVHRRGAVLHVADLAVGHAAPPC